MKADLKFKRVRGVYGKPWSKMSGIPVSPETLQRMGDVIAETIITEAKKDFAKRGWTGKDPMKGPDLWDSFTVVVHASSIEIHSTFYGLQELTSGDIPSRSMDWLKQESSEETPDATPPAGSKNPRGLRTLASRGKRPLVVPLKDKKTGNVVFRTAPLTTEKAWIHPGIAKFTFMQRAIRKGRQKAAEILKEDAIQALADGNPFA